MTETITPRRAIEAAALTLIAEWTGMTIDENIFRGALPVGVVNAAAVWLGESSRGINDLIRTTTIRMFGRFSTRDAAALFAETVGEHTPCGFTVRSGVALLYVDCPVVNEPYQSGDDGALTWNVALTLTTMARAALTSELN